MVDPATRGTAQEQQALPCLSLVARAWEGSRDVALRLRSGPHLFFRSARFLRSAAASAWPRGVCRTSLLSCLSSTLRLRTACKAGHTEATSLTFCIALQPDRGYLYLINKKDSPWQQDSDSTSGGVGLDHVVEAGRSAIVTRHHAEEERSQQWRKTVSPHPSSAWGRRTDSTRGFQTCRLCWTWTRHLNLALGICPARRCLVEIRSKASRPSKNRTVFWVRLTQSPGSS